MILEIVLTFLTIFFLILLNHLRKTPAGTPPGPFGFPLIGTLIPRNLSFIEFIEQCRKKYGQIFWVQIGTAKVLYLSDYDDIKEACNNPLFQGRNRCYGIKILYTDPSAGGIIFNDGAPWKITRRFLMKHLRDRGMGKSSMEQVVLKEAEALVEDFEMYVDKPTALPWSINAAVFNVTWGLVADKNFDVNDEQLHFLHSYLNEIINVVQWRFRYFNWMPWLPTIVPRFYVDHFLGLKEFLKKSELMNNIMKKAIKEHKKNLNKDNLVDVIDEYLDALTNSKNPPDGSDIHNTFTETNLFYVIRDLFMAGSETTSTVIRWYLLLMAKYPDIQQKVQKEIDHVCSDVKEINMSIKERLPYFMATITETMRFRSVAPFGIAHRSTADTTVGKYFIPKGTIMYVHIDAWHNDPKMWENPQQFYPDHFLNPDKTFNKDRSILTFGIGRRVCLGEDLSRMSLFLLLSSLMKKYSFSAPEGIDLSIDRHSNRPHLSSPKEFKIVITSRN